LGRIQRLISDDTIGTKILFLEDMQSFISSCSGLAFKLVSIVFLLFFIGCRAPKLPDQVTLNVGFQPGRSYLLKTERISEVTMQYFGDDKPLQKLKEMGINNPTRINKKIKTSGLLTTHTKAEDGSFKVTLKIDENNTADEKSDIAAGIVVKGRAYPGKCPEFDLVMAENVGSDQKNKLIEKVEDVFFQLSFPEKSIKPGEQFSIEKPISLPMEGSTIEMLVVTNYKLLGITDSVAKFELSQTFEMNPKILNNSFKGSGSGTGTMDYDYRNTLLLNYSLINEMVLEKKLDNFDFILRSKSSFNQSNQIRYSF
jgi:hypothetical protein